MSEKPWKKFERKFAALMGCKRYPANSGHREDIGFESDDVLGQAKEVQELSLNELTYLAEEMARKGFAENKLGVVGVKVRRGKLNKKRKRIGRGADPRSEPLVVMTFAMFQQWFDFRSGNDG